MGILQTFDLSGKIAVVTGANTGLGEAFARALAEVGAAVAITGRGEDRNKVVAASIGEAGGTAIPVVVGVAQPDQVARMVAEVTERLGPIDILVNNAGVCYHRPALEVPPEQWHEVFDINVHGLW